MKTFEFSIDIQKPVNAVYNQWTRFEDFPYFMNGVREVQQLDDSHLRWTAALGGWKKTWEAEIFEQVPDQRIGWRSTQGALNWGKVRFAPITSSSSRVTVEINCAPRGLLEHLGILFGVVKKNLQQDLKTFKEFIESRGMPPRGWRGEIHGQSLQTPAGLQLKTQPAFPMLAPCGMGN